MFPLVATLLHQLLFIQEKKGLFSSVFLVLVISSLAEFSKLLWYMSAVGRWDVEERQKQRCFYFMGLISMISITLGFCSTCLISCDILLGVSCVETVRCSTFLVPSCDNVILL